MSQVSFPPVEPRPYLLQGKIQHYAWGTMGHTAFIPKLLGITPAPNLPYAELWIGAHPKAPSDVMIDGQPVPLDQWITRYPVQLLGAPIAEKFANRLPFLFKVLSAGESLSIQAHPNKAQAEALHARDPEHYPDDNHKPEIAIALDALTALVGLKPLNQMRDTLTRYPEIAGFIGEEICGQLNAHSDAPQTGVQRLFSALITRSVTDIEALMGAIDALAGRLAITSTALTEAEALFLDLRQRYTGADVGLFALFLLNLVHLERGQGIFTEAGIPHAYLKGNIVECMANSDNVVRVGLTPKFKDAETLLDILDYTPRPVTILGNTPGVSDEVVYVTPAAEFQITRWALSPGATRVETTGGKLEALLVTNGDIAIDWQNGSRAEFHRGETVLIPACLDVFTLHAPGGAEVFKTEIPIT